ncbi:hypothetical protein E0H22_09095 [Rhodopseudomonas boonkerdii]|uniref:hypothetical protein n=1 Tax=Rhodopseudomonas boonkerdii TaxID=475937 RepID=UPI001E3B31A7|nr:hypothetical protein [Rhodopseudomonas boonkerdii]UGV25827.1 hypothetical protein E0H22_09095 [Rhodopseudomonas boonkerdii]
MTRIEYLREQAQRAERLARNVLDAVTVTRLLEASEDYRRQADRLEQRNRCGTMAQGLQPLSPGKRTTDLEIA